MDKQVMKEKLTDGKQTAFERFTIICKTDLGVEV